MATATAEKRCGCPADADGFDDSERQHDAQGIYLCRTCPACERRKLAGYRPEILSGYTQADIDEPSAGIGLPAGREFP